MSPSESHFSSVLCSCLCQFLIQVSRILFRAKLPPGSRVLELGCGWGSLSLENASTFPHLQFVSFSNSPQQIEHIRSVAAERGIRNLTVLVEDYAVFVQPEKSKVEQNLCNI